MNCVYRLPINNKSTLIQVRDWCYQATGHYLNQCWPRSHMASIGFNGFKLYSLVFWLYSTHINYEFCCKFWHFTFLLVTVVLMYFAFQFLSAMETETCGHSYDKNMHTSNDWPQKTEHLMHSWQYIPYMTLSKGGQETEYHICLIFSQWM